MQRNDPALTLAPTARAGVRRGGGFGGLFAHDRACRPKRRVPRQPGVSRLGPRPDPDRPHQAGRRHPPDQGRCAAGVSRMTACLSGSRVLEATCWERRARAEALAAAAPQCIPAAPMMPGKSRTISVTQCEVHELPQKSNTAESNMPASAFHANALQGWRSRDAAWRP